MAPSSAHRLIVGAVVMATGVALCAQTPIKLPKNKYTPEQDVQLGREAAAEVRKQYPVIKEERANRYLAEIGDRLVAVAPTELKHPAYEYSFTPVDLKEINAFALPGGPMFVNRGMFEAATTEAEVVGVMAHELAHVLLRHGTANATKAQNPWLQLGQIAGAVGGAVVGGAAGSYIAQGSQFGLGTLLLRYGRDFEKQADLLGVQIMARAGYDPRALGRMFETIAKQASGSGGTPQWLSSHPNPGNRTQYINKEAESLTVAPAPPESEFSAIRAHLASLPPAKSMAALAKGASAAEGGEAPPSVGTPGQPVPRPTGQFKEIAGGKVFKAQVPSEWTALSSKTAIKVVPQNGYGELNGQSVFTHGVEFGVTKAASRNLEEATKAWLNAVAQNNPDLRLAGQPQNVRLSQRTGLAIPLTNPSSLGGLERIGVYTTFLVDGTLFYYITIVPEADADAFEDVFQRIGDSIRLTEAR